MGVVKERQGNEAELAQAWVEYRSQVLHATSRSFPTVGSAAIEAAVDQAWVELYEQTPVGPLDGLSSRWRGLAYLRALNGVRERRRYPVDPLPVGELTATSALSDSRTVDALRAEARAQEIVNQVSGDARRWLEMVIDAPEAPPREVARTLGWDREKLKSVARRTRARLREFVSARASGVICERRQAVMEAFAATHLVQRDTAHAARLEGRLMLSGELYEQVGLHIAGCEECERAWRKAQNKLLRPRLVFIPVTLGGKLAGVGGLAFATGRRALGGLDRLLSDLRMRAGSGMGRATAGGAAGTAGTAGALAGKGAAVCVGVLCAAGAGTAALVGLPPGVIYQPASHRHHKAVVARGGQSEDRSGSPVATSEGQVTAKSEAPSTRAGGSGQSVGTTRASHKPMHPLTPGDLIATPSTTSRSESKPTASIAKAASTETTAVPTYTQQTSGTQSTTVKTTRASSSPCLPGSLGC